MNNGRKFIKEKYERVIRNKCMYCKGGSYRAVESCTERACPLHNYRIERKEIIEHQTRLF